MISFIFRKYLAMFIHHPVTQCISAFTSEGVFSFICRFLDVNKLKGSKKGVLVSWQFKTAAPVFP